ncbi:MAG TPA: DsbA family protein [Candidatus Binatia bacterium]|nr:DsbA family protein [Candidatus Binatia bacterium]
MRHVPSVLEAADQSEYEDLLVSNTEHAAERGVFGSPTFIVGQDMSFGNDRLEFLEQRLRG